MSSKSKSARGHTFYMVENDDTRKALREFRQNGINKSKILNNIKKEVKI